MRVLIVPDKFKGTLTAQQAARAIATGWSRARPGDELELCPMSDGGDGFGQILSKLLGAEPRSARTVDAAHRPCQARWWWEPRRGVAIVESARVIGLSKLPSGQFHPFELDTLGLGRVLQAVARMNPSRCMVGVGGSLTNDGGFGLARALGWRFLNRTGSGITNWTELAHCHQILPPPSRLRLGRLTVAVDVQNRLLGSGGCTRVYGPQKGLRQVDLPPAERALKTLARRINHPDRKQLDLVPGSGAAGGLGFGLMAFLGARARSGFDLFAREAQLAQRIRRAGLVITGEGCMDEQTFMGKGVGELVALCRSARVPCLALNGSSKLTRSFPEGIGSLHSMIDLTSLRRASAQPRLWLEKLAAQVAHDWPQQLRFERGEQRLGPQ